MSLNFLLQIEPVAPIASPTGVVEKSLWEIVQDSNGSGGWIINLWLTLMLGYVIFVFVERFLALNKASKEDTGFFSKVKEYILAGKIDSAKTNDAGVLNIKLKVGTYKLFEAWRFYKKATGGLVVSDFDGECLKNEWKKEIKEIVVTKKENKCSGLCFSYFNEKFEITSKSTLGYFEIT